MKEQKTQVKTSFFKKIFIKICRIFGYEIIDQSNFYVPTQLKKRILVKILIFQEKNQLLCH
jgi:hypothetical protein